MRAIFRARRYVAVVALDTIYRARRIYRSRHCKSFQSRTKWWFSTLLGKYRPSSCIRDLQTLLFVSLVSRVEVQEQPESDYNLDDQDYECDQADYHYAFDLHLVSVTSLNSDILMGL
jgi:hypothetical protein